MKRIAIFASGTGTNARAILQHFRFNPDVKVECIICNNPRAKVIEVAQEYQVPYYMITKQDLYESDHVLDLLTSTTIDLVVLAGFLWLIPQKIIEAFPKRIVNIHPALLPKYGGPGMYGSRIHEEVIRSKEMETGITIHFLNERYDEGEIIMQKTVPTETSDTPETLGSKVHELEHEWYPKVIEELLTEQPPAISSPTIQSS